MPRYDDCLSNNEILTAYDYCSPDGDWEPDESITTCFDGDIYQLDGTASCVPVECPRDDGSLAELFERIRVPQYDFCDGFSTVVFAYDECTEYGDFDFYDECIECAADEKCSEEAGDVRCVPIQCETDDGSLYAIGTRLAVPRYDDCLSNNEILTAYDYCNPDGYWYHDDSYDTCSSGDICQLDDGTVSCVPVA